MFKDDKTIAEIKFLRISKGMSQAKASEVCGVPLRTWEAWERNVTKPPQYTINLIKQNHQKYVAKLKLNTTLRKLKK